MNKGGFTMLYALMLGVLFFFIGLALAPALQDTSSEAMQGSELNCSATNNSYQTQAVCTQLDFFFPLFLGVIFGLAGFIVGGIGV